VLRLAGSSEDYTPGALIAIEEHIASTLYKAGIPAISNSAGAAAENLPISWSSGISASNAWI
jgi:hypothetical protein